jgi:hypothetical protein
MCDELITCSALRLWSRCLIYVDASRKQEQNLISVSTWSKADFLQATALEIMLGQLSVTLAFYRPQENGDVSR